jgi:branched-subunit amino acid transport protein
VSAVTVAVLVACAVSFATKLAGYSTPERWVSGPVVSRTLPLLPVAMLAALVAVQTFTAPSGGLTLDARVAGLAAAATALLLRAPFLVVIVVAAAVAATFRTLGWAA